jgi:hypothetical protein
LAKITPFLLLYLSVSCLNFRFEDWRSKLSLPSENNQITIAIDAVSPTSFKIIRMVGKKRKLLQAKKIPEGAKNPTHISAIAPRTMI